MEPNLAEAKLQLEIEKLKAEIEGLRRSARPLAGVARNTTVFTALLAAVSLGIGLLQFNKQQKANAAQLEAQSQREAAGRAEELKKTYWQEQKKLYDRALEDAGLIARATSLKDVAEQTKEFWGHFWGDMSLIESREVEKAMIDFGDALDAWKATGNKPTKPRRITPENPNPPESLEDLSLRLAHCMKQSLAKTWRSAADGDPRDAECPYEK